MLGMLMNNEQEEMWEKEVKSSFMVMLQTCIQGLTNANRNFAYTFQYSHWDHKMRFTFTTSVLIDKNKNKINQIVDYQYLECPGFESEPRDRLLRQVCRGFIQFRQENFDL